MVEIAKLAEVAASNVLLDPELARNASLGLPSAAATAKLVFSTDLQHVKLDNSPSVLAVPTVTPLVDLALELQPPASHVPKASSSSTASVSMYKPLLWVSVKARLLSPIVSKAFVILAQKAAQTANTSPSRSEPKSRTPNAPSVSLVNSCPTELVSPVVLMVLLRQLMVPALPARLAAAPVLAKQTFA